PTSAEANQRLTTPSSIDVATSERMGLLVVANLSGRHRIRVELAGADRGIRAQVLLPAQLLAPPPLHRATGGLGTPRLLPAGQSGAEPAVGTPAARPAAQPTAQPVVGPPAAEPAAQPTAQPVVGTPAAEPAVRPLVPALQPAASLAAVARGGTAAGANAGTPVLR